jgi:hypothetical protein
MIKNLRTKISWKNSNKFLVNLLLKTDFVD